MNTVGGSFDTYAVFVVDPDGIVSWYGSNQHGYPFFFTTNAKAEAVASTLRSNGNNAVFAKVDVEPIMQACMNEQAKKGLIVDPSEMRPAFAFDPVEPPWSWKWAAKFREN